MDFNGHFKFKYEWKDALQAFLGAMTGVLGLIIWFAFLGKIENYVVIRPVVGAILGIIYLYLWYRGLVTRFNDKSKAISHLMMDYLIALGTSIVVLSPLVFDKLPWEAIFTPQFTGSVPMVVSWIFLIGAVIFDMREVKDFTARYFLAGGPEPVNQIVVNPVETYCRYKYKTEEEVKNCIRNS